ncbi:MAG: ABC transporter permease [Anaerolineae bacterium]|nr:ABC transporter permease [Anaerolineae bacterium]
MSLENRDTVTAPRKQVSEVYDAIVPREEERIYVASQWQLMKWKFQKHKMAIFGGVVLIVFYVLAMFCEFFAPYDPLKFDPKLIFVPPQQIHFRDENGFRGPFVYGIKQQIDPVSFRRTYASDPTRTYKVKLFAKGDPYEMWGVFEGNLHFIGTEENAGPLHLVGTDRMGRDLLSRLITGSRISLSIGLVGVFSSLILGILIGGFSGYYGGLIDVLSQRLIEFLRSVPTLPLWMALSAAVPPFWSPTRVYFGITIILSLIGWTGMARVVRSRFLALREEDFVMAAQLAGSNEFRIVVRHMVPSFLSHIIASVTLSIPGMILGETSLSFLGVGLRPPVVSWGVMLQEAQQLSAVALSPWLLAPGVAIVLAVLCFNFLGDGLRDAADPYSR